MKTYPDEELFNYVLNELLDRGVSFSDLAEVTYSLQKEYLPELTINDCLEAVDHVMLKRDVLQHVAMAINLDKLASNQKFDQPLQSIIEQDLGQFSVDETLAIGLTGDYGNIAVTSFGFLDKHKQGKAKGLDSEQDVGNCNTFIDDALSAVSACAAARIAHNFDISSGPLIDYKKESDC